MLYRGKRGQTLESGASCSKDASLSDEVSCLDLSLDSQQEVVDSGQSNVQLPAAESRSPGAAAALLEQGQLSSKSAATQIHVGDAAASQTSQRPTDSLKGTLEGTSDGRALKGLSENVS